MTRNPHQRGTAARLKSTADYFTETQGLLLAAKNNRDDRALRRAAALVDSTRFSELPEAAQDDLLCLFKQAMNACGAMSG